MNFLLALRSLFKQKQSNLIKIISLGLGLAAGLILITNALFELSYDNFYPDSENIYLIHTRFQMGSQPERTFPVVSGAIAPGMKEEIPGIVAASRFAPLQMDGVFFTEAKQRFVGTFILADSCFFDIVPRPMLTGIAKEVLSRPMYAIVSSDVAEKMGNDAVGKTILLDSYPGREITIGGVYESMPYNSTFKYDVVVSLSSIGRFMYDGRDNWFGNDMYTGFVKLKLGIDPNSLAPAIRSMQEKRQDIVKMEETYGMKYNYYLDRLDKYHSSSDVVKRKVNLLGWIAFALIFTAILNYVLIVISTYVRRTKEMGVYKSYGASRRNISQLIYIEIFVHIVAALAIGALTIYLFRSTVEELLGIPVLALLSRQSSLMLIIIVAAIFVVTGVIPARLFSSIPVSSAFRSYRQSRSNWMLALLFVQLAAATFLCTLLVVIGLQYKLVVNDNPGYTYDQTAYCLVRGVNAGERQIAVDLLARLPDVDVVATAATLPFNGGGGNIASIPNSDREQLHIADLYGIDENYLKLMEIHIVEGRGFERGVSTKQEMIISRTFAERISNIGGWNDGVVDKDLMVTEHGLCRVVGVYDDIRIGFMGGKRENTNPSAMFYASTPQSIILIRFHQMNGDHLKKVFDLLQSTLPNKDIVVTPYKDSMLNGYNDLRLFRNSVMAGSLIALMLSLIGLLAYLRSEINRRSAEIAIRKVNGATIANVLVFFAKNVFYLSIPALAFGVMVAAYFTGKVLEDFSEKIEPGFLLFTLCSLAVLTITLAILTAGCWRVATQNPVKSLKTE